MSSGINLISGKRKFIEQQQRALVRFRRIAYISLAVVGICSILLFLLNTFSPLGKMEIQQQTLTHNLLSSKEKITKVLLLRDRLQHISPLLAQNSSLEQTIALVSLHTPGDMSIDSFGVSQDTISLVVESSSLASIDSFINFLKTQTSGKALFKKLTISSLALDVRTGKYTLSVVGTPL